MTIRGTVEKLSFEVRVVASGLDNGLTGGYASYLLSDILANGKEGNI